MEFAKGGHIEGGTKEPPAFLTYGCTYVFPAKFMKDHTKIMALLDRLNEEVYDGD